MKKSAFKDKTMDFSDEEKDASDMSFSCDNCSRCLAYAKVADVKLISDSLVLMVSFISVPGEEWWYKHISPPREHTDKVIEEDENLERTDT